MNASNPLELAWLVASTCERVGVRYILGGSLASTAMGEPRSTLDIDFVADLSPALLDPWLQRLGDDFQCDRDWAREEVQRRGSFQLIYKPLYTRIDVFVPPWEGIHLWKWQRRKRLALGSGRELDVTSADGIVLQKLVWYRDGGEVSDRQWRDVLGVLKAQPKPVDGELDAWADRLHVRDLLDRARRESGGGA